MLHRRFRKRWRQPQILQFCGDIRLIRRMHVLIKPRPPPWTPLVPAKLQDLRPSPSFTKSAITLVNGNKVPYPPPPPPPPSQVSIYAQVSISSGSEPALRSSYDLILQLCKELCLLYNLIRNSCSIFFRDTMKFLWQSVAIGIITKEHLCSCNEVWKVLSDRIMVRWCIWQTPLMLVCEVTMYCLVQVRQNLLEVSGGKTP